MSVRKWILLFLILLLVDLRGIECRKSSGGFSGGRGSSSARGSSGGSGGSTGGSSGFHGGGSGLGSASRGGTSFGRGGGVSSFSKGSGIGSIARSSTFKAAIAGAAAGYLTYQAGKAIINVATAAMLWNGRSYYWGPGYYQSRSGYEMCSMPLQNTTDTTFSDVVFQNNTRPKMIVWGCRSYTEHCCGYECCPNPNANSGFGIFGYIILVLVIVFLFMCCACFILYKFFRKTLDCILPSNSDDNKFNEYPMNTSGTTYSQVPQQTYPPQQQAYPQQPYPQQQAYPQQPYPQQQAYPQQPYPQQQAYPQQPYPQQPYPK